MSMVSAILSRVEVKKSVRMLAVVLLLGLLTACGTVSPRITYQAEFLPVEIVYSPPDHFSIEGSHSWASPIGEFSIGASYELPPRETNSIFVILRDRRTGYDNIFEVNTQGEQFSAVVNGTTVISVTNDQVLIDVTNGNIKKISFKRVNSQLAEATGKNWFSHTAHATAARWNQGWSQSWYKPYSLAKWAYDDSTIEKWYGAGFVWFLLRLIFAIVLALVDTVLTIGFLIGQLGFLVFGATGRDALYGLEVLGVLVIIIAAASA
jgi:hypothetical protein